MKRLFTVIFVLALTFIGCTKHNDNSCATVRITNSAPGCDGWGITVNGVKYPSANVPAEFQQDGMAVCANYELYQDLRMCVCCGGTWANIKSMKKL